MAIYNFNCRIITMIGNLGLHRGSDTLNGELRVIDLVSCSISLPKKN